LHPATRDAIKQVTHRVDQVHYPHIIKMRVKKYYPPDEPVPPPLPEVLMGEIRRYASMLFGMEADSYDEFRSDPRYGSWLAALADRVTRRVMTALDKLEVGDPDATIMGYHGLTIVGIKHELRTTLFEIRGQYERGTAPSQQRVATPSSVPQAVPVSPPTDNTDAQVDRKAVRESLRDSYRAMFPDLKIADIIWGAQQTRREWTRWITGEAKNGLKPDRSFRHVLTSGRKPEEIRGKPRPTKYTTPS